MTFQDFHLECLCVCVGIIGVAILARRMPLMFACLIVAVRLGVSYAYFSDPNGARYHLIDDVVYYEKAHAFLRAGFSPADVITNKHARMTLAHLAQSDHTLYYLWTASALYVFGDHYYAPVLLNILLTFCTAELLARALETMQVPRSYLRLAVAYQSLHMNYFTWVALINVKEALVECLLVAMLGSLSSFVVLGRKRNLLYAGAAGWLLLSLRLYVPILVLAGAAASTIVMRRGVYKFMLIPLLSVTVAYMGQRFGSEAHMAETGGIVAGMLRFLLTPRPWAIDPEYAFLFVASMQQWIMLGPMLIGCVGLWVQYPKSRMALCTLVVFILFYGMWPEHQGPRHRVQLSALMSLAEFQFLWMAGRVWLHRTAHQHSSFVIDSRADRRIAIGNS